MTQKLYEEIRVFLGQKANAKEYDHLSKASHRTFATTRTKFNHEEFEVDYECLDKLYNIGDYFITPLLQLSLESAPELANEIKKPTAFWSELVSGFMTSSDMNEQRKVLMTMCLIYKQHYKEIGAMK